MIYGYARCSTNESKQDISRQVRELKEMGAEEIYLEYESGTKVERPELIKMLRHIKAGDTLVVTEISRITRSTRQLCEILEHVQNNGIKLVIGGFVVDCTKSLDPMTEGMLKMMGVFSEMERNMTVERIRSGIKNAKAKGVRLGRPTLKADDLPKKFITLYERYKSGYLNKNELAQLSGVCRTTVYKWISILNGR